MLHIVVTCMGRREMVEKSIETMITQPNTTYTLVDYSCPQQTGKWVAERYPQAKVVYVEGRKHWHASEARNLGAAFVKDGWICFADSDNLLHPEFSQMVLSTITPETYLSADDSQTPLAGLLICSKEAFDRAGGYDENIRGWGFEDDDIRLSVGRVGLKRVQLPTWLVGHIDHTEESRTVNCDVKDKVHSHRVNNFYSIVKHNLRMGGVEISDAELSTFYRYLRDRYFAGQPWISWPEGEVHPRDFHRIFKHIFSLSRGYRSVTAEAWGGVRLFRTERETDTLLELLSTYNRHQVTLRAPGRSSIDVVSIRGENTDLPLIDGEATITVNAEPVFLPSYVELVKDVAVEMAPSPAGAVTVDLTPTTEMGAPVHVRVCSDNVVLYDGDINLTSAERLSLPVSVPGPEKDRHVAVSVTVDGRTQEVTRRTNFLGVPRVTEEEARQCTPPTDIYKFAVGGADMWRGKPERYTGWDDLHAEIAWGWTDTDLVCWVARWDDHPLDGYEEGQRVSVAVDGHNTKALSREGVECRLRWRDGESRCWVEWHARHTDPPWDRLGLLDREVDGNCGRMVLRIPFADLEVEPALGRTLGASIMVTDNHGEGMKGWLEWGGGIHPAMSARLYNDITLTDRH